MSYQAFQALGTLLQHEQAIYEQMAGLLEQEREALLAMAADRLGEIVAQKETLALRVKALDESRKVLARRLGALIGLTPDQVTVANLCAQAPAELAGPLAQAGEGLRRVVLRCQEINAFNAQAANRGLELVSGMMEHLLERADPAGKVYQPPAAGRAYPGAGRRTVAASLISHQA
jgi:flagellar biosynthesis/type III secretory pathway chaperone